MNWELDVFDRRIFYVSGGKYQDVVRQVKGATEEEADASARLIVAAQDMRDALENLLGIFGTPVARRKLGIDVDEEWLQEAREALAKAKGEE